MRNFFRPALPNGYLTAEDIQPILDMLEELSLTQASRGQTSGMGEGGQFVDLNEPEIVASIISGDGCRYEWRQCYPDIVAPDGTIGADGPAPVGAIGDGTPSGTATQRPAYEIKGRTDVRPGTRVFLRRSTRGPFYEFHFDGPRQYPYGYVGGGEGDGLLTSIEVTSDIWSDCSYTRYRTTITGRDLTATTAVIGGGTLPTIEIDVPTGGTISGTVTDCTLSGTVSLTTTAHTVVSCG